MRYVPGVGAETADPQFDLLKPMEASTPMRPSLLMLCSLLGCLLTLTFTGPARADDPAPPKRNPQSQAFHCPCPCDPAAAAQWLDQQVAQLGNELGPVGLKRAAEIAKALRKIGADLKRGDIDLPTAIERLDEQAALLEKLADDLNADMETTRNDTEMTPKRKESRLKELRRQLDALHIIFNGITNRKGEKVKPGLTDLINCIRKCHTQGNNR